MPMDIEQTAGPGTAATATTNYGATCGTAGLPEEGNSAALTAALIIADVVGAGILGMAVAVAKLGWLAGVVCILLLLAMNVHISMLMWRLRMHFRGQVRSYRTMVEAAFSRAPEGQRKAMSLLAGVGQYGFISSMLGIYVLSGGRALGNMFYDQYVCLPTWTLLTCAIVLPFHANARKLGTWKSLIWLNVVTITGTCLIPLAYMWSQGLENTRPPGSQFVATAHFSFADAFAALSTFSFAFTSQFMVIEIINEMKNPSEFPKAYMCMSVPFQAAAFLIVGVCGYYFVGDKVAGMIGDNIPFGFVFRAAAGCLLTHMLVTFMVKGIIIGNAVHRAVNEDAERDDSECAWRTWGLIVLGAAFMSWLIASIVPFFNELVGLIGASLTPLCCYLIPIASYMRWARDFSPKDQGTHPLKMFEDVVLALELVVALVLIVFGTYFAVSQLISNWGMFGPPFACHCQHMWNTCACSADHSGMFDICRNALESVAIQVNDMIDSNFVWVLRQARLV